MPRLPPAAPSLIAVPGRLMVADELYLGHTQQTSAPRPLKRPGKRATRKMGGSVMAAMSLSDFDLAFATTPHLGLQPAPGAPRLRSRPVRDMQGGLAEDLGVVHYGQDWACYQ